jgi:hypothetical protein
MSRYIKANHRVFMRFVRRDVWHVTFLESPPNNQGVSCWNHHLAKNFQPTVVTPVTALASIVPCATGSTTMVNQ